MVAPQKLMFETSGKSCLLLLLFVLVCAAAPYQDSSIEDISSSLSSLQDVSKRSDNSFPHFFDSNNQQLEDKRALSLFARWKPLMYSSKYPVINTRSKISTRGGTHTRPLGQPLRWG